MHSKLDEMGDWNSKAGAIDRIFLTRDAIETPNLFLSYIAHPKEHVSTTQTIFHTKSSLAR